MSLIRMNGWHRSLDHAPHRLPVARWLETEFTVPVRLRAGALRVVERGMLWCRLKTQHQ